MKTAKTRPTLMSRARDALASLAAAMLAAFTASAATMTQLVNGPSDIRVAPLVEASWAQGKVGDSPCYNSKTPQNCLCGCVATASGQIMRKWQYPTKAAKQVTNTLKVNGTDTSCTMLGGPGGVSYDWANMPFNPANEASLTTAQRNAIGTLLYDIGVAAKMNYTTDSSATYTAIMFDQFTETFGYSNAAIVGNVSGTGLTLEQFTQAVLPSLDAGMPVMVGIGGAATSHSVICDGYGYQGDDLYIHINMGWGHDSTDPTTKFNNTWYKFPTAVMNYSTKEYTSGNGVSLWPSGEQSYLNPAIYNISPTMPKGASIVSGRIFSDATDSVTLQGATVVALNTSGETVYTTTSNDKGIYALILPPGTYTLRATTSEKGARRLASVSATAGTRSGATATGVVIGNQHGVDLDLTENVGDVLAAGLLTDCFVEYVESTGSQYVDTEVIGRYGIKATADMAWIDTTSSSDVTFLGARQSDNRFLLVHNYQNWWFYGYGKAGYNKDRGPFAALTSGTRYTVTSEITTDDQFNLTCASGAYNKDLSSYTTKLNTGLNLYIFAMNKDGSAQAKSKAKCYGLKIWQVPDDGTDYVLVRNFIPCVRNGRPGLYDAVSRKMFYSRSGSDFTAGPIVTPAELTHRWSFTSDYSDSVGTANAAVTGGSGVSVSDGRAVLAGGDNAGYLDLGEGVLGSGDATLEMWFEKLGSPSSWAYAFSYAADGSSSDNMFALSTAWGWNSNSDNGTGVSIVPVYMNIGGTWYGTTSSGASTVYTLAYLLPNLPQHISVTFKKNSDGSTTVRWMSRDAATGFLLKECSNTIPSWTLADASAFRLLLGRNPYGWSTVHTLNSRFDEVRVWNGVLTDEQLSANVLAGPDATFSDGITGMIVDPGETFEVNGTTGGYGYWTDKVVTLRTGAKIRFNTADYFGTGLRFRAGGFVLPVGETDLLSFVELDDTENYTVSLENANTILVQLKDAIPHTSTWTGATPSSAADLSNAANWTSVNAKGATIAAAPAAKTTVLIPAEKLATFTLPGGVSANWGRVLLGGYTKTQWGRIADTGLNNIDIGFRDRPVSDYTADGEKDVSYLNRTSGNFPSELGGSQLRFDGWINVSAAQAGRWNIRCNMDDMIAFAVDGEWQFMHNTWRFGITAGCYVSEGWHRFTLIVRDTWGGYGVSTSLNGTNYPFVLSVNGGAEIGFSQLTFGTGSTAVALSDNANWAGLGPIFMESGLTMDLNGHSLTVSALDGDFVSTVFKNTSATASTLYTYTGTVGTGVLTDNLTVSKLPVATAEWTNAAGDNDASNPANWTCKDSSGNVLDGALPTSDTTTTVNKLPAATLSGASDAFASSSLKVGDASRGEFLQENGTVALGSGHISTAAAGSGLYAMSNGTLTASKEFEVGGRGVGEFVQTGGTTTLNSWLNIGRYGGTGIVTVNGGSLVNTYNNDVYVGCEGGTGTINVGGDGYVEVYNLRLGAGWWSNNKGYVNISGNGHLKTRNWAALCNYNGYSGMYGEVNQSGGTFEVGTDMCVGERSSGVGVYNMTGGNLTARVLRIGWNSGANGTFNMGGGDVSLSGDLIVGVLSGATGAFVMDDGTFETAWWIHVGNPGTGSFVQNGGTVTLKEATNSSGNWLSLSDASGGNGTYTINGGTLEVGTGAQGGGIFAGRRGTGVFTINGGTVITPTITADDSGTSTVLLNGGTIKAAKDGGEASSAHASDIGIIKNIDNLVFGNGTTIDTDGYSTAITGCGYSANSGSSLVKAGAGTLTAAMPPVNTLTVSNGVFALSAAADNNITGRTLEVANGATVNLGGFALTQPVIAGAGTVQNGTLTVTEKIRVKAGEKLTFTGVTLDLTGTTVEVADTDNLSTAFVFAESDTAITGTPASGVKGWKVKRSADGKTLTLAKVKGMMIIAK